MSSIRGPSVSKSFFNGAVERARAALREAGKDVTRLEGYGWHSNRHSFASRLVMAGVDLRTEVRPLGTSSSTCGGRGARCAAGSPAETEPKRPETVPADRS